MIRSIVVLFRVCILVIMVVIGFPALVVGFLFAFLFAVFNSGRKLYDEDFQKWLD